MGSGRFARRCERLICLATVLLSLATPPVHAGTATFDHRIETVVALGRSFGAAVPAGYRLELLTADLELPRLLTFAPGGDLFIGSRSGHVYRLEPPYTLPRVFVKLDKYPHSVAFRPGEVLIARTDGLYRGPYEPGQDRLAAADVTLLAALPGGRGHNSRTVRIGPDGQIYVSLGIAGNCSDQFLGEPYPFPRQRGGVVVLVEDAGGARWQPFAAGLRNPVGFDWHPATGVMYASNNGPDHLGFELPPEYFSRLTAGSFHGMPWYQFDGERLRRDPCIVSEPPREDPTPPAATFPARNAPMAVVFVPEGALDARFTGDAIVALRGSWGTSPTGSSNGDPRTRRHPKLVVVRFTDGQVARVDDFVTGFQVEDGSRWARPVGVAIGPDGALYFTSDHAVNGLFRLRRME